MIRRIIDVSHHQDPIDFAKVAKDGIVAVIAKATEGATWIDPAYEGFKRAAAKYNLRWGSYHFGTGTDVSKQVDHYLSVVRPAANELICLDFEENPTASTMTVEQARDFVALVERKIGTFPLLYGGVWLKNQLGGQVDDLLTHCPLWIAQYANKPVLPPGWPKYALWQYTDGISGPRPHEVDGIGQCDRNQYNGTIAQLRKAWPFRTGRVTAK